MKFDFLSESDQAYYIHKASTLVEALPYIREHAGQIVVIKYGGHAMGNPKLSKSFSEDIGLIRAISKNYNVSYPPSKRFLDKISKLHSGYRSVFTWYMWRSIDPVDVEY